MLRLNTSLGEVFVEVEAENVPSPYRVQPNVGRRFPLGMAVQPRVKLFNPHPEPLRITQVSTVRGVVTVHPILADGAAGVVVPPMSEREVARIVASPSQPGRVADLIRIAFRDTTLVVPFDAYFARPGVLVEPGHVDAGLQVRFRNTFAATLTVESVVSSSPRVVVLAAGTRSPTHRNGGTEAVTVAVLLGAESDSAIQPAWSRHCGDDVHPASSARSGASLRASPCLSPARGFALSADVPPPAAVRASLFVNASITLPASRSAGSHTGRAALHTTSLFRFPFEGVSGQITVQAARACVWDAAFFASDVREGGPSACAHPPAGLVPALRRLERRWIDLSHADPAAGRRAGGSHDGAVERDASSRSGAVTNAKELGDGRSEVEGGAGHAGSADDDLEELDEEGEEEVWEEGQEEDGASGGP
ncbi:hypothetical protein FNF27_06210 [Cafeteria roenbergensis]|uniref:TMEM131 second Ig-like domain-containing protein n=1 Tax=Cafeteria roenbergensis TaxID=33653 RepID=A0A5A8E7U2_CAFRO|nr:hypothetical protein FNF27_06210 [Cafeteria roenbergensis]